MRDRVKIKGLLVGLAALTLVGCLDRSQGDGGDIFGTWFFCDGTCSTLGPHGIKFTTDGKFVELGDGDAKGTRYCEMPASANAGTFIYNGYVLQTTVPGGVVVERDFEILINGDLYEATINYRAENNWSGGLFKVRRTSGKSVGKCYDPTIKKEDGEPCVPAGFGFHADSKMPPTLPGQSASEQCKGGACVSLLCPSGKIESFCAKVGPFCMSKDFKVPGIDPQPGDPVLCQADESCVLFPSNPRCIKQRLICPRR